MPISNNILIPREGEWVEVNLDKGTWNIYPENSNSMLYLSIDKNGTNPVLIDDNTHDFTFNQPTNVYLKADNIVSPLTVYYNNFSVKISKATPTTPQSNNVVLTNVWKQVTLNEGTWNIYTDNSKNIIQVSLDQNGSNPVSITGDKRQFYFDAQTNVYMRIQTVDPDLQVKVYYNNFSVISIEGGGSGGSVNLSNYYTKAETYNRTEINGLLTSKANDADVVKLTGDQTIAGDKTYSGVGKFINYVDIDTATNTTYPFMMRFVGDKWASGQSADLFRFHKYGGACGYKVYLNGPYFNYAEIYGKTLISNMIDPTEDAHGANVRWVKNNALPKVTTDAVNTIQVSNNSSKYFNFDYVMTGTGYRNWSGIQLRAKRDTGSFENMWKVEYRNENNLGLFMECIGNKLNFVSDTKIVGVSCEDSDDEKTAASKKYVDDAKAELKTELKSIVASSTDFNDFKSKMNSW